ncbi:MAG: hypothetical protein WBX25_29225, partial [Rhodomicrobium sp.]
QDARSSLLRSAQLAASPLGGLTPADVPLIEAEILSEQPGPPQVTIDIPRHPKAFLSKTKISCFSPRQLLLCLSAASLLWVSLVRGCLSLALGHDCLLG